MIIRITLTDGDANKVFKKDIPSIPGSVFVDIQGDFAIVSAEKSALLINWRVGGRLRLKEVGLFLVWSCNSFTSLSPCYLGQFGDSASTMQSNKAIFDLRL